MAGIKITEKGQIGVMAALEQMRRGGEFTVVFVYGSGKQQGEIGLRRCVYGAPLSNVARASGVKKGVVGTNLIGDHVAKGTLPLTDLDGVEGDNYISLLISHLRYFNNYLIIH